MKNFNFNEKIDIENEIAAGYVDESNYRITIGRLALYNLKILGMNREDNYDAIKQYMASNANDFFEAEYQKIIYNEITSAKKRILRDIDDVIITQRELNQIALLNDIKKEKIAFVLVATAKYYDAIKKTNEHFTNLTNVELCKLSRVTIKRTERDIFMSFIYDDEIVERHNRPNSSGKKVLFVDENVDVIALKLSEIDFQELAYVYLDYINNHVGYSQCEKCGRKIKQNKARTKKYCENCAKKVEKENCKLRVQKFRDKRNESKNNSK